jgi:hypothetical protein
VLCGFVRDVVSDAQRIDTLVTDAAPADVAPDEDLEVRYGRAILPDFHAALSRGVLAELLGLPVALVAPLAPTTRIARLGAAVRGEPAAVAA